jgi:spermidine/putrescine transport system ATP-binding protein
LSDRDLVIERLTKRFASFVAVDDLSVTVPQGSFFALLGPSGCGKTTTLRMVAGLEIPTAGAIRLGDTDISRLKPYQRPVNTVFQSYALFPHLTIFENVAFGLRRQGKQNVKAEVEAMLELVELGPYAARKPAQLSGGQQQRVAVARALINKPEVLLLDEPLGALDLKLRRGMQIELKRIQTVGITFVHVTHDQEEAMTMADTIAVMNAGVIEQLGSPAELYDHPATTFAANFLGQSNLVAGRIAGSDGDGLVLDVEGTRLAASKARSRVVSGDAWVGVRPEKVSLATPGKAPADTNVLPGGTVTDASFVGVSIQYLVRMPWGQELTIFAQNDGVHVPFAVADKAELCWRPENTFVLDSSQDVTAGADLEDEG